MQEREILMQFRTCPQCGAGCESGENCEARFNLMLVKEMEAPAYGAVHHISVPCYMLQHNAYSREGWLMVRDLIYQFVYGNVTPEIARRQFRARSAKPKAFSITRGPKLPGVEEIRWTRTIADVRVDTAEHYRADVREWAKSILADSEALIRKR